MGMILCKECATAVYPGTLFCNECGYFLGEEAQKAPDTQEAKVPHIRILIPMSGRQLHLDLTSPLWIGRTDPDTDFWPRLDLSDDGGVDLGVSRRHAMISCIAGDVVLVDKSSANGTWLDGERLQAQRLYPLPQKAVLRFGKLSVHFMLEKE